MSELNLDRLLKYRCIGPFRGGRVVAVAGDPVNKNTFYFGACAGGVFKTVDGGNYWECVSDGYFKTGSVGALHVADSDPNVIYAGMGETTIRIDVSHGDGVYKSTDAGRSWQHMGLADTRHIAKVRTHPNNPDLVYVAAFGHAFGPNKERGVYRSQDGGKTWEHILFRSEKAGAIDLTIDRNNPRIIYAAMWEAHRSFWQISSGGPDSSIYRSMDGGDTWEEIKTNKGLPQSLLGKIGLVTSPAQAGRVWALIEAKEKAGLYRSDNYGDTWEKMADAGELLGRPWYYAHLTACTQDPNTVYVNNFNFWKSIDGGKNFTEIHTPHGDNHDLWIDPENPQRMVQGNDGGANVSYNGGFTWSTILNQPTAQFYHLDVDNQYPYHVYGTQQDNSSIAVPSMSERGAIMWASCYPAATGESGYIAVRPDDHNIVYAGAIGSSPGGGSSLQRYDHRTKQVRMITNWPEGNWGYGAEVDKYRFNWTYPIVISPHDPNVLYIGGNQVLRTTDEGQTWEEISPDLTRAEPHTLQKTGGPINLDSIGAEAYATVFSFIESQHQQGLFWAGSDDGLIHISKDGGANWANVTPPDMPEFMMIQMIEESPHDPATVYVAGSRHKLDDYTPYMYKTADYGQTWTAITDGFREDDFLRCVRADPMRRGLLYAGTETGIYVSFNDGDSWQSLQLNLPVSPVYDLKIKNNDLVVGTHGRSFWILDDITPLHQISDEMMGSKLHLFQPRDAVRPVPILFEGWDNPRPGKNYYASFTDIAAHYATHNDENVIERKFLDAGDNPPSGTIITYYLAQAPTEALSLTILDGAGNEIRTFTTKPADADDKKDREASVVYLTAHQGMNRFVWDMRYPPTTRVKGKEASAVAMSGPVAVPGSYQARLSLGATSMTQSFAVLADPRVTTSQEDFQAQFDMLIAIRDKISECNDTVNRVLDIQKQIDGWLERLGGKDAKVKEAGESLKKTLKAALDPIMVAGLKDGVAALNHGMRLAAKLGNMAPVVYSADFKPSQGATAVFAELSDRIDEQMTQIQAVLEGDVIRFSQLVQEAGATGLLVT
ncbi:MAG: glycosyl hydrolase [Chloroflexota bacterium]